MLGRVWKGSWARSVGDHAGESIVVRSSQLYKKSTAQEVSRLLLDPWLHYFLAMWLWAMHLAFLSLHVHHRGDFNDTYFIDGVVKTK